MISRVERPLTRIKRGLGLLAEALLRF